MLWPWALQRRYALAVAAHRLCAGGSRVGGGAVRHVAVGDVCAARRRRMVVLVVEAQGRGAADGLRGPNALAVRVGRGVVGGFRVQRAGAEQRVGPLVALLLEALRAHGPEEAVGSQRDMGPARRRRRTATRRADAALHAARPAPFCARPSVLAARTRVRGCDGRRARGRQACLSRRARHAQHAALFGRRHCWSVAVAVTVAVTGAVVFTNCMASRRDAVGVGCVRGKERVGGKERGRRDGRNRECDEGAKGAWCLMW